VTHFTNAYAGNLMKTKDPKERLRHDYASPVVPVHRYVRAIEMVNPTAYSATNAFTATLSVVSQVAASSNVPVQGLLDLIWMIEGEMCSFKNAANSMTNLTDTKGMMNMVIAVIGKMFEPIYAVDRGIGSFWMALNQADSENAGLADFTLTGDHDGWYGDLSEAEPFQTPSPLVLRVGFYLPSDSWGYGYQGDSATTDDAGLMTGIGKMDNLDPAFRPNRILILLTTDEPWMIERYFRETASMYSTFLPLSRIVEDHGVNCKASEKLDVMNPYYLFHPSTEPSFTTALVSIENVQVLPNFFHNIDGGFSVSLEMFQLVQDAADRAFLTWLPNDYGTTLMGLDFPNYQSQRGRVSSMFAMEFLPGFATFATTCFRGYLAICLLIVQGTAVGGATSFEKCSEQSVLNQIFHNENVLTSLLTISPDDSNPFEPLRVAVTNKMNGFAFWAHTSIAQESDWNVR